jgi:hypothetical protein
MTRSIHDAEKQNIKTSRNLDCSLSLKDRLLNSTLCKNRHQPKDWIKSGHSRFLLAIQAFTSKKTDLEQVECLVVISLVHLYIIYAAVYVVS